MESSNSSEVEVHKNNSDMYSSFAKIVLDPNSEPSAVRSEGIDRLDEASPDSPQQLGVSSSSPQLPVETKEQVEMEIEEDVMPKIRFSTPDDGEDLKIELDSGSTLYAHLAVLSQWTPFFKESCTPDGSSESMKRIKLSNVSEESVARFLLKVYPPCNLPITKDNAAQLFVVSVMVDATYLRKMCTKILESLEPSLDLALLADRYKGELGNLYVTMVQWMAENFSIISENPRFVDLSKEAILEVIKLNKHGNESTVDEPPRKKPRFWFF